MQKFRAPSQRATRSFLLGAVLLIGVGIYAGYQHWRSDTFDLYRPLSASPTAFDKEYSRKFLDGTEADEARFEMLFAYFAKGFFDHAENAGAAVHYAGLPSLRGYEISGLEGFARTGPLLAARIFSGRQRTFIDPQTGQTIDLVEVLRDAVIRGVDPKGPAYWGDMGADDQRVVEAADIARLLWLTRDTIWASYSPSERALVCEWLSQAVTAPISNRNNWLLFPELVAAFLTSVGERPRSTYDKYYEFKKNYLEAGWFRDGPRGHVDFYNAWGISYDLFWLHLMDPKLDPDFIRTALSSSANLTAHLISPAGVPIMGRSVCYRTAIASPLIASAFLGDQGASPGLAKRALDTSWRYFIERGALRDGSLTMGYFETDPRLVDWYTGAGSCHWGLRSLTLAFMIPSKASFWSQATSPLPIELGDYRLAYPKLGWIISGYHSSGEIEISIPANHRTSVKIEPYGAGTIILEQVLARPMRPKNEAVKYDLKHYSASRPLGGLLSPSSASSPTDRR